GLLSEIKGGLIRPVYLIFGDRYLCQEVADDLVRHLLPDEKQRNLGLRRIDGEQEDVAQTMSHLQTYSLFAGREVIRVMDSQIFFSKAVAKNFWDKAKKAASEAKAEKAGRYLLKMIHAGGLDRDESLQDLSGAQWKKLFGFDKPGDVAWCADLALPAGFPDEKAAAGDELVLQVLEKGIPKSNVLILVTEAVDKRKKLYKLLGDLGAVIDLSVDSGAGSAARKGRDAVISDLVVRTLADLGKKPGPKVVDSLLDRVGFHPVAAVRETEKLALYVGDAQVVTLADVDAIIGQTREEAIYELNDAVASASLARSLELVGRLHAAGLHPLALVAGLRNLLRKLLFFRALRERRQPYYSAEHSFPAFQKGYLTELKSTDYGKSPFLAGHPFVLYKSFQQAGNFDLQTLQEALAQLLEAEFQLKSSGLPPRLVLERFLFAFLGADSRREKTPR
ncbi:MAG: DNA polymerase III subunit delta, partial [Proteobacteria bacterium]|nr:DNA polymerase III subunit delta [Pseudomonadota bacterium]